MSDVSLSSAVAAAAAELSAKAGAEVLGGTPPAETPVAENEETPEGESEGDGEGDGEGTTEESDLSETEVIESKNLYKALKDPKTAGPIIAALAQQMGLLSGEKKPETKTEVAAAKKDIKAILAESLGKEYSFLADRLGPAIEAVINQEREEQEARFTEIQQTNVEREVVAAYESLAKETKGESKKFESRMAQLSEEVPIGNMNVKTYMQRLYTLASNERKSSPQKVADQIRRNASDIPNRLRTGAVPFSEAKLPDKKLSLNDSVNWAVSEINKGKRG